MTLDLLHSRRFNSTAPSVEMDDLVSEVNEEVIKTKPKKRLKDNSAELGKQLNERLKDARMCKKPKATASTNKPRTFNREYIYSGRSIKPKGSGIRTKVKATSSKPNITVESVPGLIQ